MNIIVEVSEEVKSSQYDRVQFLGLISKDVIAQYVWNQGQDNQYTQLHVEQL